MNEKMDPKTEKFFRDDKKKRIQKDQERDLRQIGDPRDIEFWNRWMTSPSTPEVQ